MTTDTGNSPARPSGLIYGLEDRPPVIEAILIAMQHSNSQYENNSHKNIHFEQLSMAGIPILPFIKLSAQAFRGSDFSTNVSK